jgi:hypothetical protein
MDGILSKLFKRWHTLTVITRFVLIAAAVAII